jgi:hypothetical protein
MFVWRGGTIQIAENRAACGGRSGLLAARAADTYRQKSYRLIAEKCAAYSYGGCPRFDSAGRPRVTHSSTNRKIKLRQPRCVVGMRYHDNNASHLVPRMQVKVLRAFPVVTWPKMDPGA